MLDASLRETVIEYLLPAVDANGDAVLVNAIPPLLRRYFVRAGNSITLLRTAIRICEDDGYNCNPSSLSLFISQTAMGLQKQDDLLAIALRLQIQPPGLADPYEDRVIRHFYPFLDRKPLRAALRRLLANSAAPVLTINGPPGSGKSFTSHFIDHLAQNKAEIEHCIVKAADDTDPPAVLDIARDLMAMLGGEPGSLSPPGTTNQKRWPRDLAHEVSARLVKRTDAAPHTWVVVLDICGQSKLAPEVATFIHQLATNFTTGAGRHHHRLVLINVPPDALPGMEMHSEDVDIEGLSTVEAQSELDRLFADLGRTDAAALASGILDGLVEPHEDMREIGRRTTLVLRRLVA